MHKTNTSNNHKTDRERNDTPVKETWLILSYCSNADGRAAALHVDNRLTYLKRSGIRPLILSGPYFPRHTDVTHFRVPSLAPSGIRFEVRALINQAVRNRLCNNLLKLLLLIPLLPFYLLEKAIFDIESQWSWYLLAAARGHRLVGQYNASLIYSSGGSVSAHLAARLIARWHRIPWIAEFQDPLVHDDWQRSRRALKIYGIIERLICADADAIVFLTEKARERAAERTSLGERGIVVYPGANPPPVPVQPYNRGEFCRFVHLGSLGKTRNLKVFLEALALYLKEYPAMRSIVRVELYGVCDPISAEIISSFPHRELIKDFGRVSHMESLNIMGKADVLLLIQDTGEVSEETIPSKTYEYLLAARPILALVYKNRELRGILAELGHRSADAASVREVENEIVAMVQQWQSGSYVPISSPFTVDAAVAKLVKIAGESIASRGPAQRVDDEE